MDGQQKHPDKQKLFRNPKEKNRQGRQNTFRSKLHRKDRESQLEWNEEDRLEPEVEKPAMESLEVLSEKCHEWYNGLLY